MRKTKYAVVLSAEERAQLRTLVGRGVAPARRQTHARILLKAAQGAGGAGWSDAAIAGALEVHPAAVARVRQQYVAEGLEAALDRRAPRRAYARRPDGEREARLIAVACGAPPSRCGWRWWRPSRTRRCAAP
ncbi:MAG TPA: helix-turn-helix domain-containing protein [Thermomicrobiales bacterium]|nr:helix-turn-helix domain-containing protein [Thermomicrobiales bacterium]